MTQAEKNLTTLVTSVITLKKTSQHRIITNDSKNKSFQLKIKFSDREEIHASVHTYQQQSETDFDPKLVCWNTEGKDGTVKLVLRSDCEYFKLEILWRNH